MIVLALEEFASRRRLKQRVIEEKLRPFVERALDGKINTRGYGELIGEVAKEWAEAYEDVRGEPGPKLPRTFRAQITDTLRKTDRPRADATTAKNITVWLATAILGHATLTAADDDTEDLLLEWVDMNDTKVRHTHRDANGQKVKPGEPFTVGGAKMPYPGYPGVEVALWINCRCATRPILNQSTEAIVAAGLHERYAAAQSKSRLVNHGIILLPDASPAWALMEHMRGMQLTPEERRAIDAELDLATRLPSAETVTAAAPGTDPGTLPCVVVALPDPQDQVHGIGTEQKHITLCYFGDPTDTAAIHSAVSGMADQTEPFIANVSGTGSLGDQGAQVWIVEHPQLQALHDSLTAMGQSDDASRFPHYVPHMTAGYPDQAGDVTAASEPPADLATKMKPVKDIAINRLAVWHGENQTEYPLGGSVSENAPEAKAPADTKPNAAGDGPIPWHAVLAPEGVRSGDGRKFASGAMRSRPLPLPITWQKVSAPGHAGSPVVSRMDRAERVGGEIRASGVVLQNADADEMIGLVSSFGRFGISVDADDATLEADPDAEDVTFSDARLVGACIVPIPAFHQAWFALGEEPADFFDGGTPLATDGPMVDQSLVASVAVGETEMFLDVAPGVTEDGPGWLTHPIDTDRLRDYWVRGEGAAKIGWGAPGDFDRCRTNLAPYVKPEFLSGYCANRHKDALGVWPGQEASVAEQLELTEPDEALTLVASAGVIKAPAEWFALEEFDHITPLTITEQGQVYGHVADWNACHQNVSAYGECFLPPRSQTNYARFMLGSCLTTEGEVAVGCLTIGGAHAAGNLRMRPALAHYDNTTTAWADVRATDGEHGIWVCGWVRPGTSPEMVVAARASKPSGDWRLDAQTGGFEMIAALSVNTPGYQVPRVAAGMADGQMVSLVAAGAFEAEEEQPAVIDPVRFAEQVVTEMANIEQRRKKMAELAAARLTKEGV